MTDPLLPEVTGRLIDAVDRRLAPSSLRALAADLLAEARAAEVTRLANMPMPELIDTILGARHDGR